MSEPTANNTNEKQDLECVDESDLTHANGGARARTSLIRAGIKWATRGEGRTYFRRGAAAGAGFETGRRAIQHVGPGREE